VLVAHLSDPHLVTVAESPRPGAALRRAFDRMLALDPRPDQVVLTGDLADHGQPAEYEALRVILDAVPLPVLLATGNHDDRAALLAVFAGTDHLAGTDTTHYVVESAESTLAVLDSLVPGEPGGRLGPGQLSWLDGALDRRPGVPAFVVVHHPPVDLGMPFLDSIRLADGDALAAVVAAHPNVVRVLSGHVHRQVTTAFAGTVLTTASSTFLQTALLTSSGRPPGYVAEPPSFLLHLLTGTTCVTHTVLLPPPPRRLRWPPATTPGATLGLDA